jgi:uncharacterized protein (DUF488 family)
MPTLFTIGHSTRTLQEFIKLLSENQIKRVVDVRTIPKSRSFPWFNKNSLSIELRKKKISYVHLPKLGGLRHGLKDSVNRGWHNASFRGFADYMQTPAFFQGIKKLNEYVKKGKVVIMCAEAVPWRCHRSMIADAEIVRGTRVKHIVSASSVLNHELTSFAVVDKTKRPIKIFYPISE